MPALSHKKAADILSKRYDQKMMVVEVMHVLPLDIGHAVVFTLKTKPADKGPRAKRGMGAHPFRIYQQRVAHIDDNGDVPVNLIFVSDMVDERIAAKVQVVRVRHAAGENYELSHQLSTGKIHVFEVAVGKRQAEAIAKEEAKKFKCKWSHVDA